MNKFVGLGCVAGAIALFIASRKQKVSGPKPIDPNVDFVYEDGKIPMMPSQKTNVLNPESNNATNLPIMTSSPIKVSHDVNILSGVRL